MWRKHFWMAPEADDGSGGGDDEVNTEVEAPDDSEAARQAAEEAAQGGSGTPNPPPPPAAPANDQLMQQINALMEQNRSLAAQLQTRQRPDPEEEEKLDPDVERIIARRMAKAQAPVMQQVAQLADLQDQQNFTSVIREYGYDQPTVDAAKTVFTNWRRAGIAATREDALFYVVGRGDATARRTRGGKPATPKPPNPHAVVERTGGKGAPVSRGGPSVKLDETPRTAKERAEWIKKFEAEQEKAGAF